MTEVDVSVTVTMQHRKARSVCHAAPLSLPTADELDQFADLFASVPDDERFTCSACAQPTTRVLVDPVTVTASNG